MIKEKYFAVRKENCKFSIVETKSKYYGMNQICTVFSGEQDSLVIAKKIAQALNICENLNQLTKKEAKEIITLFLKK